MTVTGAPLEVHGITVDFGGHRALCAVDFAAEPGAVTGLIGPNGAGKTTLFNVITGLLRPTRGRVVVDGVDISGKKPYRRARLGVARTFQRLELFTLLNVRDNVNVAAGIRRRWGKDGEDPTGQVDAILDRVGLAAHADARVDSLPTGQARLVELARALATRPRVLLLDEPASGQTESETEQFGRLVRELAADGMTVVLVEHDVSLVMAACDRISVLDFGRIIAEGTPDEVRRDQAVLSAYLGTAVPSGGGDR